MKEQFPVVVLSLKYSSVTFFLPLFLASGLWHMKYWQNRIEKLWRAFLHRHFADIRREMHVTEPWLKHKSQKKLKGWRHCFYLFAWQECFLNVCFLLSFLKAANDEIPIGKMVWESSVDALAEFFGKHLKELLSYHPACLHHCAATFNSI